MLNAKPTISRIVGWALAIIVVIAIILVALALLVPVSSPGVYTTPIEELPTPGPTLEPARQCWEEAGLESYTAHVLAISGWCGSTYWIAVLNGEVYSVVDTDGHEECLPPLSVDEAFDQLDEWRADANAAGDDSWTFESACLPYDDLLQISIHQDSKAMSDSRTGYTFIEVTPLEPTSD